jgi:hypothetical protein
MQKISALDTSKISLVKNKFQPAGTTLYDLKIDGKPLIIYSFGIVDSPVMKSTMFGDKMNFKFKPPAEDYAGLGDLDTHDYGALLGEELGTHKSMFDSGYIMNVKLGQRKTGFGFSNNVGLTVANIDDFIVPGKSVTVIGTVGLWVREPVALTEATYGVYFTLTDLQLEKDEPPKKVAQRKTK